MKNVSCLAVAAAFALAGCMTDRTKSLFNPPSIHSSDDAASAAGAAGAIPVDQYYAALKGAQGKRRTAPRSTIT
jgi:hypothetical protein